MDIEDLIKKSLQQALKSVFDLSVSLEEISLQPTKKEFEGTYTFVTFPYVKQTKKSPEETGKLLGDFIKENTQIVSGYNVVKGFLNFVISDKVWINLFSELATQKELGNYPKNGQKVM